MRHQTRRIRRRGAAVYVHVLCLAMIVSLLGMSGLTLVRLERRGQQQTVDGLQAHANADSAVALAMHSLAHDDNWRTTYTHGVTTTPLAFSTGTVSWTVSDTTDTDLADDPMDPVEVKGVGRVGNATWATSVQLTPTLSESAVLEHRSYEALVWLDWVTIHDDSWRGQFLRPTLPANATEWSVTSIELRLKKSGSANGTVRIRLYHPNGSEYPAALIESVDVREDDLSPSFSWYTIAFSSATQLDPTQGICIGVESTGSSGCQIEFDDTISGESNSRFLIGNLTNGWTSDATNKALRYRVNGTVTVLAMPPIEGTWRRVAP